MRTRFCIVKRVQAVRVLDALRVDESHGMLTDFFCLPLCKLPEARDCALSQDKVRGLEQLAQVRHQLPEVHDLAGKHVELLETLDGFRLDYGVRMVLKDGARAQEGRPS